MKFSINPFSDIVWSNHDNSSVMKWQWLLTTRFSCTKSNLELHGQVMYYNVDVRLALIIAFCKYGNNVAWLVKLLINFSICSVKIRLLKALAQIRIHLPNVFGTMYIPFRWLHFEAMAYRLLISGKKKNLVGFFSYSFIFSCWWSVVLRLVDFELSPFWFTIVTYFNSDIVNILNPLIHALHLCFLQPFLTTYLISRQFYCQPIRFGILY